MKEKKPKKEPTPLLLPTLADKLLISMPVLNGDIFRQSLLYICEHNEEGAMGLIINQEMPHVTFSNLLENMKLPPSSLLSDPVICFGGPVDANRGFILHSSDVATVDTIKVTKDISISASADMVKLISEGAGPEKSIFALGYAGWDPGQLEAEILNNLWLTIDSDYELIFNTRAAEKWASALKKLGIAPEALTAQSGRA